MDSLKKTATEGLEHKSTESVVRPEIKLGEFDSAIVFRDKEDGSGHVELVIPEGEGDATMGAIIATAFVMFLQKEPEAVQAMVQKYVPYSGLTVETGPNEEAN